MTRRRKQMAASPGYKVYDKHGVYQAACKEPEAAGALVSLYGEGSTIRHGHSLVVWREGAEAIPAGESYDTVALTVRQRIHDFERGVVLPIAALDQQDKPLSRNRKGSVMHALVGPTEE
ncbi:MAG: hypothetical protein KGL39_39030 [Patescibacteria group bacterium]|nr:hypothetical protein [Patescibacteria group bacterium]